MPHTWAFPSLERIGQDARHAARTLARQRGFAIVTMTVLAVTTGLNTSLCTLFSALKFHAQAGIITRPAWRASIRPSCPTRASVRLAGTIFSRSMPTE